MVHDHLDDVKYEKMLCVRGYQCQRVFGPHEQIHPFYIRGSITVCPAPKPNIHYIPNTKRGINLPRGPINLQHWTQVFSEGLSALDPDSMHIDLTP